MPRNLWTSYLSPRLFGGCFPCRWTTNHAQGLVTFQNTTRVFWQIANVVDFNADWLGKLGAIHSIHAQHPASKLGTFDPHPLNSQITSDWKTESADWNITIVNGRLLRLVRWLA